jgi:signal transduction histidine kinase
VEDSSYGTREPRGTALGLAVVRAVAGSHGGSLTVHEGPQAGGMTLLRLELPDPLPPEATSPPTAAAGDAAAALEPRQ